MKVFDLTCNLDHSFEGWFASHEEFDRQLAAGLVDCPVCGSRAVQSRGDMEGLPLRHELEAYDLRRSA